MKEDTRPQKATGSIRNQALDTMKLILSVFAVMIHAEVDNGIAKPFLRIAVPLFFITSAYFFFRKTGACGSNRERWGVLLQFLKRNMLLYLFWFAVLLPVTLYVRGWFSGSILQGILGLIQSFLFNSTFRASWYIMALNIGMCMALLMSLWLSPGVQILVTLPVYLLCSLFSNYYGFAARFDGIMAANNGYIAVFRSLCNSFPVSLLWLVKDSGSRWQPVKRSGHISTIAYACHASVITVVAAVVRRIMGSGFAGLNWVIFGVSLAVCAAVCAIVYRLEKHRRFRWLRWAY